MDSAVGDFLVGDVVVADGLIVDVGTNLEAPEGAAVIDASNTIVLPGFVDVHWHMWNSILKGMSHDAPGYFALHTLAEYFTPDDYYTAICHAATEGLNAGITTCHNWANTSGGDEDAQAQAQALVDSGIRSRFGYAHRPTETSPPVSERDLERMQAWIDRSADGLMDLGLVSQKQSNFRREVEVARARELRTIGQHINLADDLDLLGPDMMVTHGPGMSRQFKALLAERKTKLGLCPTTDPLIGAGLPPLSDFLEAGFAFEDIGFSVDVSCQTGVDPFAAMRIMMNAMRIDQQNGASFEQIIFTPGDPEDPTNGLTMPRKVLEIATINGARVLGIDDKVGSLTPGKRADIILVRNDDLNMLPAPETNATFQLVQLAQPSNVDTVLVDGRVVKQNGRMIGVDTRSIGENAARVQQEVTHRSGHVRISTAL
jgi:5-methylthioadenosine/S-adenosylhomocysteine deaminase